MRGLLAGELVENLGRRIVEREEADAPDDAERGVRRRDDEADDERQQEDGAPAVDHGTFTTSFALPVMSCRISGSVIPYARSMAASRR